MEDGICVNLIGFLQEFPKLKNLSINHTSNWNTGVDPDFDFFGTIMNLKNLFHLKISANMDLSETISNGLLENIKALERSGDLGNQFNQLKSLSLEIPKLTAPYIKHIISFINPNKSRHVTINMNPYNWSELNFDYRRPVGNDNNVDLKYVDWLLVKHRKCVHLFRSMH